MQTLEEDGTFNNFGSITLRKGDLEHLAECIEHFASSRPKTEAKVRGMPPTKYIVVAVEPNHLRRGGDSLELGEVVTTLELVAFLKDADSKLSPTLVRYYTKEHKPFIQGGYTFRLMEDFLRDLRGAASTNHQAVAEAHAAWAEENRVEAFQ